MMKEKVVIGVAGMPGSGKASVKNAALEMGYPVVVMGDEIREEAKRRKLKPTLENLGKLMLKLRAEEGEAVVARRCIPKIERTEEKVVIVDGIRSQRESSEFKKRFPRFFLIAFHASPEIRFQRLLQRKRSDRPMSWEAFMQRESRELNVGLDDVIATADYVLTNEGTKRQLKSEVRKVLERVIGKWMK
jgi:dephospho-CoA kinase